MLSQRQVKHGTCRLIQAKARKLCVAHYSHDTERSCILGQVNAKVLVQRVFISSEKALHEGLVHNGHWCRSLIVLFRKATPAQDRYAEILKIIGTHPVP